MSRFKKYVGIAVLVGIVAALGISSVASAQSPVTPTPTAPTTQTAPRDGFGPRGLHSQAALEAAAKALGMTADELSATVGRQDAGRHRRKGVDIADVKAAVDAALVAKPRPQLSRL
jgi:hypothetical protein